MKLGWYGIQDKVFNQAYKANSKTILKNKHNGSGKDMRTTKEKKESLIDRMKVIQGTEQNMLLMAHRSDLRGVLNKIGIRGYLYFYKGLKSNNMKEGEKAKYI